MILLISCIAMVSSVGETSFVPLFEAVRSVETGGIADARDAVGDGGRSIGPYQISRAYWMDSGVPGHWMFCKDRAYAESVMLAYWKRHCPDALRVRDFATLARVHNGGPVGHRLSATLPYWKLVRTHLTKLQTTRSARYATRTTAGNARATISHRLGRVNWINSRAERLAVGGPRQRGVG